MKLIIGNLTQQVHDFLYRMPGTGKLVQQRIPIGGQTPLSGDYGSVEIDAIIAQHRRYGLVSVDEIDRTKEFVGLCYSVDRYINIDALRQGITHNFGVLEERGKAMRQEAAVAVNNSIEQNAREQRMPLINRLEMTIEEEAKKGDARAGVDELRSSTLHEEGIKVDRRADTRGKKKG